MLERQLEAILCRRVKEAGGKAYKFVSPGNAGVPDRICVFPGGRIVFVEMKAPGRLPRRSQAAKIRELVGLGCEVWVVTGRRGVEDFMAAMGGARV